MGPKPKSGKKKKGEGEDAGIETADQAEWKALKTEADRLHKTTKREEHDFNEFQQQREKLNYFWIVEKKKLDDKRVELRNKEREQQDLEEKNQVEVKIYKQRLKHLLYEQQNELTNKKTEAEVAVKMAQDDDREQISDIKEDRRVLNINVKEIEFTHEEYIRGMKREQDQKITMLRHEFERKAGETQKTYDMRMKKTRDALDKVRKDQIKTIEEKKHIMIDYLMTEHQKAFADIKNYYNDITHNNLDLIKSLKEEVKDLEIEERKDQLRLQEKMNENKKLSAPLKKMQEDVVKLQNELFEYNKEKEEMRRVKAALLVVETGQSGSTWEHETLLQRLDDLRKERDELKANLNATIFDIKQKSLFRGMLLEKKLLAMNRLQEEREAQLIEVLNRANLDPSVLGQVKGNIDDILTRKNNEAKKYQSEISRLQAMQIELNLFAKQKLNEYGLTMSELGYEPIQAKLLTQSQQFKNSGPALQSEAY